MHESKGHEVNKLRIALEGSLVVLVFGSWLIANIHLHNEIAQERFYARNQVQIIEQERNEDLNLLLRQAKDLQSLREQVADISGAVALNTATEQVTSQNLNGIITQLDQLSSSLRAAQNKQQFLKSLENIYVPGPSTLDYYYSR